MKNKTLIYSVLLAGLLTAFMVGCKKETPKTAPVVSIGDVKNIKASSAAIAGEITSDGGAPVASAGICWSTTNANPTIWDLKTTNPVSSNSFSSAITGLSPGTTYNLRAYATNSIGIAYSTKTTFKTLDTLSSLTINSYNVSSLSVVIESNITADGGKEITARGVCWSTNQNPTTAENKTTDGSGKGSFTSAITGLIPGTTYYLRAYATNSVGTAYGHQLAIKTLAPLPVIILNPITNFTATEATCNAEITSDGGSTIIERGFVYNTSPNPTMSNVKLSKGTGLGSFNAKLYIHPGTTYYVRAYANSSNGTAYSNQESFTTLSSAPSLSTNAVTNITPTTATCGATINYDGGSEITARGVCWSESDNPTIADFKTTDGTGSSNFTSVMTGLIPGRIYYVRSYATNSLGTSYGYHRIFNTLLENCNSCEIVKIKYGWSFNMSVGYSRQDVILSSGSVIFTKQGFSGTPPPVTCTSVLSDTEWNALKTGVDITTFFSVPAVIGCPDCSDGGSEWIEMELNHGEKHRSNWDYSDGAPAAIKDYVAYLRNLMRNYANACP
jgi:hypothetical protein